MASSSTVSTGDVATAAQYNNLRIDVLDTSSGHSHTGTDSADLGTLTADLTISQSGASQIEVISTANDAYLILNSDTDEGQDSEIIFESGGTARGRIEYNHHATANSQLMSFFTADNAVETLKLAGNLATFATDVTISGDDTNLIMDKSYIEIQEDPSPPDHLDDHIRLFGTSIHGLGISTEEHASAKYTSVGADHLQFEVAATISTVAGDLTLNPADDVIISDAVTINGSAPTAAGLSIEYAKDEDYDDYKSNMGAAASTAHGFNIKNTATGGSAVERYALMNFLSTYESGAAAQAVIGNVATGTKDGNFIVGVRDNAAGTVTERTRVDYNGNLLIGGTAQHGSTVGTKAISLFNGTAPAGTLTNGASFFCASGEMKVIDAAGNTTTLSPHDDDGQWVFHSKDTVTGEVLHIHMEKLMRRLNDEFGGGFIEEFIER